MTDHGFLTARIDAASGPESDADHASVPWCSFTKTALATAALRRWPAERGATAHEIMAVAGHRSLEEVERYTRAARQSRLVDSAMRKFRSGTDSVPPSQSAEKSQSDQT